MTRRPKVRDRQLAKLITELNTTKSERHVGGTIKSPFLD